MPRAGKGGGVTESQSPKIKRCPFCNSRPVVECIERLDIPGFRDFIIRCDRFACKVKPRVRSISRLDEARNAWNRREGKDANP